MLNRRLARVFLEYMRRHGDIHDHDVAEQLPGELDAEELKSKEMAIQTAEEDGAQKVEGLGESVDGTQPVVEDDFKSIDALSAVEFATRIDAFDDAVRSKLQGGAREVPIDDGEGEKEGEKHDA